MNAVGASGSRVLVMREYRATVGATDGNIIAAIITTQTPRNQPNAPTEVHGPSSIPRICPTIHHQPSAARANSASTSRRVALMISVSCWMWSRSPGIC